MSSGRLTAQASRGAVALLATIAYLPVLLTKPGRMPTDTKLYLYLDPGRLVADAPFTWDTRQFGGWVPHQTIAYLWPQGPWYWCFDRIGVPDWVAHRLWLGTLLFLGALGVMWVGRLLGLTRAGAITAAVVYQLSPYILPYASRTSAMLLPWAALGWLVGLTIRAATSEQRWRHPALMGLVLVSCSAVNATAIMMIAPAPVLWLVHAAWQRRITWQRAVTTSLRVVAFALPASLWWVVMLRTQGKWGADVLAYSESLQAVSFTSTSTETLRGLGYWLFYVRDPYAFTTTASQPYMESVKLIGIGFVLLLLCLVGLAVTRWSQRRYAALLVFAGIVLGVGVHPIDDASPLMSPLAEHSRSGLALAIRSSTRALPMANLGLALGAAALVSAVAATRWRARTFAPFFVVALAVLNLPALFDGGLVDSALERDQDPPAAWQQAADDLSASDTEMRVLQLPGSEFGAFRWGYTVDPPLPGLTTKPLVTRDLLPLGSPGVMDLLYALDDRVQDNTVDARTIAAAARFLGADTIWVANDLAFDRFRTPHPEGARELLAGDELGAVRAYGPPAPNVPDLPMIDETTLARDDIGVGLPPVELVAVPEPVRIVRASASVVVVVGSGDGVLDAAAAGLLHGDEAVLYAADVTAADDVRPAMVVVTDSNRDRAHHWRGSQDVVGFTESGGPDADVLRTDSADQRLPVFTNQSSETQTIATLDTGLIVRASGYGEPFAYRPEQRPAMAVDGDPETAWVVGDRSNPVGEFITVSRTDGPLRLLQPQATNANRMITSVSIDRSDNSGTPLEVALDERSLRAPGQTVDAPEGTALRITITGVGPRPGGNDTGPSAVGFAELGIGTHPELVRVPTAGTELAGADTAVAVVLSRQRSDPLNRWRSDPEPLLRREFTLDRDRSFRLKVTLHRNDRAADPLLDRIAGITGATADRRLLGDAGSRGVFAADGDPATAWTSPFVDPVGSTLTIPVDGTPFSTVAIRQRSGEQFSRITRVRLDVDGDVIELDVPPPDTSGESRLSLPREVTGTTMRLTITGIEAATTVDRRYAEVTTLPVSISEVSSEAVVPPIDVTDAPAAECDTQLLQIDGRSVGLLVDQDSREALARGEHIDVPLCDDVAIDLAAGAHRVETAKGLSTGIDVDRVVLSPILPAAERPNPTVEVSRTRLTRTATVGACPAGCWLILGEGYNTGWEATVDGRSLGEPRQIAGGFNGWWLPASSSPTTVDMRWTAQPPVSVALVLSAVAVVGCLVFALRRRSPAAPVGVTPPILDGSVLARAPMRASVLTAVLIVVVAAVVASPATGALCLVPASIVVLFRRPRLASVMAVALMAAIAGRVVQRQLGSRFIAGAGWPQLFERLHRPALAVVVLVAIATLWDRDAA